MTDDNLGANNTSSNDANSHAISPIEQHRHHHNSQGMNSPCFIHSRLDNVLESSRHDSHYFDSRNSASSSSHDTYKTDQTDDTASTSKEKSLQKKNQDRKKRPEPRHRGAQGAVEPESESEGEEGSDASTSKNSSSGSYTGSDNSDSEDDYDRVRSLTRQLAETAVGVREMSKQLGRARVKSTINSILIITKARDNHLIKLTRELAIWLMNTPRNGKDTGLIVYVDAQLRQSKRFDAEGIKKDHPHLFLPGSARQQSFSDADADSNGHAKSETSSTTSSRGGSISQAREESQLRYWTSDMCSRSPHLFDFVVTLGGDGTVLFCSWLFQRIVPPVMPFALGSLGFLTNFDYSDYEKAFKSAFDNGIRVNLRMRFTATVYRATLPSSSAVNRQRTRAIRSGKTREIIMKTIQEGGWNSLETPLPPHGDLRGSMTEDSSADMNADRPAPEATTTDERPKGKKDKEILCFSTRPVETFEVLNDLVVDRGPSPYVSQLEVFGDEHHMTTAQADGLCISTPTGSTAYSLSAGGSLVHPEIPAILITPICPHTLSFRPMLLPDSMELRIAVPYNSRSTAWASFDGRGRVELKQGDHIKVTASKYPFPTICADNQSIDWFESISRTLKWNERQRQKSFVVVEEGNEEHEKRRKSKEKSKKTVEPTEEAVSKETGDGPQGDKKKGGEDDDDSDDSEGEGMNVEEEAFDIDDTSTVATRANSPDPNREKTHHHHHRRQSSHGSSRSNRPSPSSIGTSQFLQKLQPLTSSSTAQSPRAANDSREAVSKSRKSSSSAMDRSAHSSSSLKVSSGPQDDQGVGKQDNNVKERGTERDRVDETFKTNHLGIDQVSKKSLLDSPDRFGLAGPPQPPRAISERHLATADFRLDGGKEEETSPLQKPDQEETTRQKSRSRSNSRREGAQSTAKSDTVGSLDSDTPGLEDQEGASKSADRLYKKLRSRIRKSKSVLRDEKGNIELDYSASNSRNGGGGTALVVYGQDESDSDSTAEGY
ncbi:hypothetical protein CBS101457_006234 [Exobasidium rhododendri]|nr:hypothetical protein CBS101457_006234 [Exobasidium rhododendri]